MPLKKYINFLSHYFFFTRTFFISLWPKSRAEACILYIETMLSLIEGILGIFQHMIEVFNVKVYLGIHYKIVYFCRTFKVLCSLVTNRSVFLVVKISIYASNKRVNYLSKALQPHCYTELTVIRWPSEYKYKLVLTNRFVIRKNRDRTRNFFI